MDYEGGVMFETAMPAFKGVLTTEQIWKNLHARRLPSIA